MGSALSFRVDRWVKMATPSGMVSRSLSIGSVLQPGQESVHALGEAAFDLVPAVAVLVLALLEGIVDVAGLPHELLEREDVAAPRLLVGPEHLFLLLGHGQDEMRLRDELAVAPEIGGGDGVFREMNPVLAEHDARIQGRDHAIAGMVCDTPRAHGHERAGLPLLEHLLEEHVGHDAAAGVGVTDEEDVLQRASRRRDVGTVLNALPGATARSARPFPGPSTPPWAARGGCGRSWCRAPLGGPS